MGKSSSSDLRVRIVGEIERGQSCRAAARRFGVAPSTAVRLAQRKGADGIAGTGAARSPGWQWSACCLCCDADWLGRTRRRHHHAQAGGAADGPKAGKRAPGIALAAVASARLYRQKKLLASETDHADVVGARQVWIDHRQLWMKKRPERLIFIDETGNHNQDDAAARPGTQGEAAEDESALWSLGNTNLHRSASP